MRSIERQVRQLEQQAIEQALELLRSAYLSLTPAECYLLATDKNNPEIHRIVAERGQYRAAQIISNVVRSEAEANALVAPVMAELVPILQGRVDAERRRREREQTYGAKAAVMHNPR